MLESPASRTRIVLLGRAQLEQMPHGRRQNIVVAFEVVVVFLEAAERARDIVRDRRLLGDDELLAHASQLARTKRAQDDKYKNSAAQGQGSRGPRVGTCDRSAMTSGSFNGCAET